MDDLIDFIEAEFVGCGIPLPHEELFFKIYSNNNEITSRKQLIQQLFNAFDQIGIEGFAGATDIFKAVTIVFKTPPVQTAEEQEKTEAYLKIWGGLLTLFSCKFFLTIADDPKPIFEEILLQLDNLNAEFKLLGIEEYLPPSIREFYQTKYNLCPDKKIESYYWFNEKADKIDKLYDVLLENKYIEANEHFLESFNNVEVNPDHRTRWKAGQVELILLVRSLSGQKAEHKGESIYAIICKLFINAKGNKMQDFDPDGLRALNSQNYHKLSGTQRPSPKQQALKNLIDFL